jgi:hypothetical protein
MDTMGILDLVIKVGGLATLIIGIWTFSRNIKTNRDSNYIRSESSSIEAFKMMIENPELSKLYTESNSVNASAITEIQAIKLKEYAAIVLNLFEIQFQLRKSKSISAVRFASWVPWILTLIKGHYFKLIWADLRIHYVPEFRNMIDELIIESNSGNDKLYEIASKHMNNCKIIKNWLTH